MNPANRKPGLPRIEGDAMTDELLRRCIVCEEDIQVATNGPTMPMDAVVFRAVGNFGSGVYDPQPTERYSTHLRIYLCDLCVEAKSANGMIEMVRSYIVSDKTMTWQPGKSFAS